MLSFYITLTILKNGSIIAIISVQIIHQTTTITIGSIAVCIFFTSSSICFEYLIEIFLSKSANLQVSSHIFTTEANSIGNKKFSFQVCISSIHIQELKVFHLDTLFVIFFNSFS
jgi:hypothetical protein